MDIVDYLSREPSGEPWPDSKLDKKFVVASIDQFHAALDCLNRRLVDTNTFIDDENILEHSDRRSTLDELSNTSSPGCYSNRFVQNQTKLDRNENGQNSRLCNFDQNSLKKISHCVQLVEIDKKNEQRKIAAKQVEKTKDRLMEKKLKKTDKLSREEPQKLWSFWDLVGSERTDNIRPENMLQLEASSEWESPQGNSASTNVPNIIEVDLTADSTSESPEVSLVDLTADSTSESPECLLNLSKLFDKNLLAELFTEDTWMDRLRRVKERKDRHSFELMGPYTNSLWHQMSVVDDCIVVDGRMAVPGQLRPAALKRIHCGHPGQEAMIDVSRYLWWPHMHKDIVNMRRIVEVALATVRMLNMLY